MQRFIYTLLLLGIATSVSAQIQHTDTLSVGYAKGNLKTMSGSVEKVGEDRMNKGLITNSLDALSGQAAGVSISTGTNTSAMLSSVRVRGTTSLTGGNDPLVIIDGVQSDLTTLSNIYPGDIESCFDEKAKCYKTHCLIDREEDVVDAVFIVYMGDNYFYIYDSQKQSGENLLLFGRYFFKHDHFKMIIYHRGSYRDPFFNQFSEIILEQNK